MADAALSPDPDGSKNHRGAQSPPDHLLLDLFNMPVVEPYAISDPFSTAGKINMNTQIVPFTYITRDTGVRAVLRPEQLLVLGVADATNYKQQSSTVATKRSFLDLDETMKGFQQRFASGEIFRSATEICDLWLVPRGQTYAGCSSECQFARRRQRPRTALRRYLSPPDHEIEHLHVHYRVQTWARCARRPQINGSRARIRSQASIAGRRPSSGISTRAIRRFRITPRLPTRSRSIISINPRAGDEAVCAMKHQIPSRHRPPGLSAWWSCSWSSA